MLFKELGSLPEFFLWELCRIQDNFSPHNHFGVLLWNKLYTTLMAQIIEWSMAKLLIARWRMRV